MFAYSSHVTEDSTTLAGSELLRAGDASSGGRDKTFFSFSKTHIENVTQCILDEKQQKNRMFGTIGV